VVINPDAAALAKSLHIRNDGDKPVWLQVTARGVPKEPLPAAANRLSVYRQYFTLTGEKVDLANIRQTDRIVVSLSGDSLQGGYHQVACSTCCRPASRSRPWSTTRPPSRCRSS